MEIYSQLARIAVSILAGLISSCSSRQTPQVLPPDLPDRFMNSIGMEMQFVPGGTFLMGSDEKTDFYGRGKAALFAPEHEVSLDAFYMARFELTIAQYEDFARETGRYDTNPAFNPTLRKGVRFWTNYPHQPMVNADWYTANTFCEWLSNKEGRVYRLPTEAEWEYVAKGGQELPGYYRPESKLTWSHSEHCAAIDASAFLGLAIVGSFSMTPWGFHDMRGNAPEWTLDWYARRYDPFDRHHNPNGPWWGKWFGKYKVRRGGINPQSSAPADSCNPVFRRPALPEEAVGAIRLVCPIDADFPVPKPLSADIPPPAPIEVNPDLIYETWEIEPGIEIKMVWIPPGEFLMGSFPWDADGKVSEYHEVPVTPVVINEGFYMSVYEITQEQFRAVTGTAPGIFVGDDLPAHGLTYDQIKSFLDGLTNLTRQLGKLPGGAKFKLPLEGQWEYACRAGTLTDYYFGDNPNLLPHFGLSDCLEGPRPVGQGLPNRWGLYDMHGNVAETCWGRLDHTYQWMYHDVRRKLPVMRTPGTLGGPRTLRGGAWANLPHRCRSATRHTKHSEEAEPISGLRIIRTIGEREIPPNPPIEPESIETFPAKEYPWEKYYPHVAKEYRKYEESL